MLDKTLMMQIQRLNQLPINKLAKTYLEQAGEKPPTEQETLHVYRLMQWAMETGEVTLGKPEDTADLLTLVEKLMYRINPMKAMSYLVNEGEDNGADWIYSMMQREKTPTDAAAWLIGIMHEKATQYHLTLLRGCAQRYQQAPDRSDSL